MKTTPSFLRGFARFIAVVALALAWSSPAKAYCTDKTMINPITDVAWDCIFPFIVMGIPLDFGEHPPDSGGTDMFCACPNKRFPGDPGLGLMVGFWEPARMIDTVNDSWCFPGLGLDLGGGVTSGGGWGYSGSGRLSKMGDHIAFQNYHYYIMPIWAVLNLFTDIPCISEEKSFDLAMVSEVRPDWGDDITAMQLYPETSVMASPFTALACIADAVAATFQRPIDALYWCMGAWGTTYPMTGNITATDYVAANAGIAGKAMFVQARTALLPDRAVNYCNQTPMPIWIKRHWRIQQVDPVVDGKCRAIGYPGLLWTQRKNPIGRQDNFSWLLFRKVRCCLVIL